MKNQLSRDEINKLLGVDPTERVPTKNEIIQIEVAVEAVANERNIPSSEISTKEINEIVKNIGIKIWTSYVQNNTPQAHRILWTYSDKKNETSCSTLILTSSSHCSFVSGIHVLKVRANISLRAIFGLLERAHPLRYF